MRLLGLALGLCFFVAAAPATERPLPNQEALAWQALVQSLPSDQVLELTTAEDEVFFGLWLVAERPQARGNLLLLHGDGQHPHWPQGMAPLREQLSRHGWNTLSIQLPADLMRANAQTQNRVEQRLQAAWGHLDTPDLLILQGAAIYQAMDWMADRLPADLPLVLLHAEVPQVAQTTELANLLQTWDNRPLLDIYDGRRSDQRVWAEERARAYRRAGNRRAEPMALSMDPMDRGHQADRWLGQRVEGWLRRLDD